MEFIGKSQENQKKIASFTRPHFSVPLRCLFNVKRKITAATLVLRAMRIPHFSCPLFFRNSSFTTSIAGEVSSSVRVGLIRYVERLRGNIRLAFAGNYVVVCIYFKASRIQSLSNVRPPIHRQHQHINCALHGPRVSKARLRRRAARRTQARVQQTALESRPSPWAVMGWCFHYDKLSKVQANVMD